MGAVRSVGRAQWAAYFLLGAGILAPWNALLTAIDYFALLFPGAHIDRLFTCAYLPSCLLLLVLVVCYDVPKLSTHTRVASCYAGFTLLLAAVPLIDWLVADAPGISAAGELSYSRAALAWLLTAVVAVGALDGACQGSVFSEAAQHGGGTATQAVASGTACSGLLISLLRLASKAIWQRGSTATLDDLRPSAALFFAASATITAACTWVYCVTLPALRDARTEGGQLSVELGRTSYHLRANCIQQQQQQHLLQQQQPDLAVQLSCGSGDALCSNGSSLQEQHAVQGTVATNTLPQHQRLLEGDRGFQLASVAEGEGVMSRGSEKEDEALEERDAADADDVVCMESLLRSPASDVPYGVHNMYSGLGLHATALDCLAGSAADGGKWGGLAARRVALTQCWAATWPYCFALAATYTCTLAIFPGFLAEDVHSDVLGDWFPLLVIATFNAGDLAGKLSGPGCTMPVQASPGVVISIDSGRRTTIADGLRAVGTWAERAWAALPAQILQRPVRLTYLALARGGAMLTLFVAAAALSAPPWVIIPATFKLGFTNGWLTVAAMAGGPALLPHPHLTELGEGLLVISLVLGLTCGAFLGWTWLLVV